MTIINNIVSNAPVTANTGVNFDRQSWLGSLKAKNSRTILNELLDLTYKPPNIFKCRHLLAGVVA
jgi:hypothetical protein